MVANGQFISVGPSTFADWVADANEELAAKADLAGSIFSGDVTVQGTFNSRGIDDNATQEVMQLDNNQIGFTTSSGTFVLRNIGTDDFLAITGGNAGSSGGNIRLFGQDHVSQAGDIDFRSDASTKLIWDDSNTRWDFNDTQIRNLSALTRGVDNSTLFIGGGTASTIGPNIILFGSSHGTDPNRIEIRQGAADKLVWDGTQWDFQNLAVLGINTLELEGNRGIRVDINTGELTISGGNGKAVGANKILYGSGHLTQASDHETRTGSTVRKRWDQSAALWDYLNHDVGGIKALTADMLAFGAAQLLTIATGVIDATDLSNIRVATEASAATDDLDTINGAVDGQILIIRASDGADTVVCKDGIGNLDLEAGDFSLDSLRDQIVLRFEAALSVWLELSRSNNA